jgi:hypothetical protein
MLLVISDGVLIADSLEYAQTPLAQELLHRKAGDALANVIWARARAGKS